MREGATGSLVRLRVASMRDRSVAVHHSVNVRS